MGYKSYTDGELYVVVWNEPSAAEVRQVINEITDHRAKVGKPLLYAGVIPTNSKVPGDEARQEMGLSMATLEGAADEIFVVYEGAGFAAAAIRSVIAAVMIRSTGKRKATMVASLEAAAAKASTPPRRALLQEAARRLTALPGRSTG